MKTTKVVLICSVIILILPLIIHESIAAPRTAGWTELFAELNYGGPDGVVNDIIEYNNGLIVAGQFESVGGLLSGTTAVNNIAAFDGSVWHSLGSGLRATDSVTVNAMVEYDGDLIVAGSFDTAGSLTASNIARWNSWTGGWEPLGSGISGGDYPTVFALYIFDGELYAGGLFTTAGSVTAQNIAKWDGASWSAVGVGRPTPVYCFTEWDDQLVAGSSYNAEYPENSVAYLVDGMYWRNIGFKSRVNALVTMDYEGEDDVLIAAGSSVPVAGTIEGNLWHYDANLGQWYEFEGGIGRDGTFTSNVHDLFVYDDKLIVTGNFHVVGDKATQADGIAYWQGKWNRLGEGLGEQGIALYVDPGKKALYVGGDIWYTGEYNTENLGQYIFKTKGR